MKQEPDFVVRSALASDYHAFSRLFPELQVNDPVPSLAIWTTTLVPSTLIAARGDDVLGYCYFQELFDTGYVRNIVVEPGVRRLRVGQTLMKATADQLRSHGKTSWRLNVKPSNHAARSLYEKMGMKPKYTAKSFRFPWSAMKSLPGGASAIRELTSDRDAEVERLFDLPRGQLEYSRGMNRILLEAVSTTTSQCVGLAVFDPTFPGAFPFRVKELEAVSALLISMRKHVPDDLHVSVVAEDDQLLVNLLLSVGAAEKDEILHMAGPL